MSRLVQHRGPDASGCKVSPFAALGAERLRVRDIRPEADQPLADAQNRWLVCNGEIYNAAHLRQRFLSYPYRSRSDVEPLLPLLAEDGAGGLGDVDGMFALAWWDPIEHQLILARDRAGEKPLFYLENGDEIWFASEIQALRVHPDFRSVIDEVAVMDYAAFGYAREPHTLFEQVRKVPAGTFIRFGRDGRTTGPIGFPEISATDAPTDVMHLRRLLEAAVTKQIEADIPVGVFCSGGLDSSLVTTIAARAVGAHRLQTFSVRFPERSFDESHHARRLAQALGTRHVESIADMSALNLALHTLAERLAEPVADPAILPTLILSERARQDVGVVLSGEGADELFGGYPTYVGHRFAQRCNRVPLTMRRAAQAMLRRSAASTSRMPTAMLVERFVRGLSMDPAERHVTWFGTGLFPFLPTEDRMRILRSLGTVSDDPADWAMRVDFDTYLREGLLVKLDRATMLVSLEARAPFLDAALIAFARQLPLRRKVNGIRGKVILRELGAELLPRWIVRRRKHGLSVPIGSWINNGLRAEVDRLLGSRCLIGREVLPGLPVDRLLAEHRDGVANHSRALWAMIMLQLWFERWGFGESS